MTNNKLSRDSDTYQDLLDTRTKYNGENTINKDSLEGYITYTLQIEESWESLTKHIEIADCPPDELSTHFNKTPEELCRPIHQGGDHHWTGKITHIESTFTYQFTVTHPDNTTTTYCTTETPQDIADSVLWDILQNNSITPLTINPDDTDTHLNLTLTDTNTTFTATTNTPVRQTDASFDQLVNYLQLVETPTDPITGTIDHLEDPPHTDGITLVLDTPIGELTKTYTTPESEDSELWTVADAFTNQRADPILLENEPVKITYNPTPNTNGFTLTHWEFTTPETTPTTAKNNSGIRGKLSSILTL